MYSPIKGYENYVICSNGSIFSIKSRKHLKARNNGRGYLHVGLCKNGRQNMYLIHRLIAVHFIENPHNKPYIDHIDGNRSNNDLNNLRWVFMDQNSHNAKKRKDNTSNIKGVSWNKNANKWTVQIKFRSKQYYGGLFIDIQDAQNKAIEMRIELHGDFANHG